MTIRIAILGGTSHVAKGLTSQFLQNENIKLYLFSRNKDRNISFINSLPEINDNWCIHEKFETLNSIKIDCLINCVGAGTPNILGGNYHRWFTTNERFDNIALQYLYENSNCLYVNFSSGAVYGKNTEHEIYSLNPNQLDSSDMYSLQNLCSEARHRSFPNLRIIDIRIFNHFNQFADLNAGYLITDIAKALYSNTPFTTSKCDITRDFVSPHDLTQLILLANTKPKINTSFDVYSRRPVSKYALVDTLINEFRLKVHWCADTKNITPNKTGQQYLPNKNRFPLFGYKPIHASIDTIKDELHKLLNSKNNENI